MNTHFAQNSWTLNVLFLMISVLAARIQNNFEQTFNKRRQLVNSYLNSLLWDGSLGFCQFVSTPGNSNHRWSFSESGGQLDTDFSSNAPGGTWHNDNSTSKTHDCREETRNLELAKRTSSETFWSSKIGIFDRLKQLLSLFLTSYQVIDKLSLLFDKHHDHPMFPSDHDS